MKRLLGIIFAILAGCSTMKPTGSINIAYVPERTDKGIEYKDEILTEFDLGLKSEIRNRIEAIVGGRFRTYSSLIKRSIFLKPERQEYDIYARFLNKDNWEFYAEHTCEHLLDRSSPEEYSDETKIGIKFKF